MNMNGRGKRKRDQAIQGDTHSRDTDDIDRKRESRKPKQTESRLTANRGNKTKRHGIENTAEPWDAARHGDT